jgi:hypothetical protein
MYGTSSAHRLLLREARSIMNRKQIKNIPLIAQNVYSVYLEDIDHDQVASDINLYSKGVNEKAPEYGWISRGFVQYEDLIIPVTPEITKLENTVIDAMKHLTERDYKIHEGWAILLQQGQSVIAHNHHSNLHANPGEFYSVAYYPQAPEGSTELIFSANWCGVRNITVPVAPKKGLLLIFNSYITHMTARQQPKEPRMVVSMNLGPVTPNLAPNADWSVYANRLVVDNPKPVNGN